jgi:DNA-binding MarR family transcriptional regulator
MPTRTKSPEQTKAAKAAKRSPARAPRHATEPYEPSAEAEAVVLPALLRAARGSYGHAIRASLAEAGFADVPRNGAFVLGGIVNQGVSAGDLVRQLGVSKQAASQLIDTLVVRGYLNRSPDQEDRRRVTLEATERGRAAAAAVRAAVVSVDEELAGLLTAGQLAGLRAGLVALIDIRERMEDAHRALAM